MLQEAVTIETLLFSCNAILMALVAYLASSWKTGLTKDLDIISNKLEQFKESAAQLHIKIEERRFEALQAFATKTSHDRVKEEQIKLAKRLLKVEQCVLGKDYGRRSDD